MDEYRYHESLVHIPMNYAGHRKKVLILGGGDGLAARELLKYSDVKKIIIVDLDKKITDIARTNRLLTDLNNNSLLDPRVEVINEDAFTFLAESMKAFDLIIADLPDPNDVSLSKLYSREFYKLILRNLGPGGIFSGQSTSPYYSREAFWCIRSSMKAAGFPFTYPYHVNIPSFGEWGFIMASRDKIDINSFNLEIPTRFLTEDISSFFHFQKDLQETPVQTSSLDSPAILAYYLEGWDKFK